MFLYRRPLARFRWQEAEPAIYLQPYIPDDLGELAASEMPQLGSTQGLLDMMGGGSSAEEEGGPPRKQRRLEETALGARPAPPEEVAEEITDRTRCVLRSPLLSQSGGNVGPALQGRS